MILIFGGAYQGKLTWAVDRYALAREDIWDLAGGLPEQPAACYTHLEALTWQAVQAGETAGQLLARVTLLFSGSIVISREIGSGVVPMDKDQRQWRELHGQVLQALARQAGTVIRIFCGIPEVWKCS